MSFLVDTDVLSDPSRPQPSPKVDAWLAAHQSQIYTSAISIGELKRGIERLPTGAKRNGLEKWLEAVLASMDGRILAYNSRVAETWGAMMANCRSCMSSRSLGHNWRSVGPKSPFMSLLRSWPGHPGWWLLYTWRS